MSTATKATAAAALAAATLFASYSATPAAAHRAPQPTALPHAQEPAAPSEAVPALAVPHAPVLAGIPLPRVSPETLAQPAQAPLARPTVLATDLPFAARFAAPVVQLPEQSKVVSQAITGKPVAALPVPAAAAPPPAPAVIAPTTGAVALTTAMTAKGTPYVWGGTSTKGFDCSGLMQWAFKKAGVTLPRSSSAQSTAGQAVSKSDLRAGDLVFFYSPVSHVGIYIGDGQVLHAPQSGDVVKVSPLSRMPFHNARRV